MKTLVFGASLKSHRFSNKAIQKLVSLDYKVVAYGLKQGVVGGIEIDTTLQAYENVHTVTIYMNANRQEEFYDYIVGLKPKRVIFNPGAENPDFFKILMLAEIECEVACTLVLLSSNHYEPQESK